MRLGAFWLRNCHHGEVVSDVDTFMLGGKAKRPRQS